jgi:arsenite methyltransferase
MTSYLDYTFEDNDNFISTFDELPLWCASFGLLMLKHLELKPNLVVLDIGSGAGFPLLELAGRLGSSCKLYGIDPWKTANQRAGQKIKNYGYTNVEMIEASAEQLPFQDNSIDLVVSNLGINNFANPGPVFKECQRVLKPGGRLVLTTNLNGHWKEFYEIFRSTLQVEGKTAYLAQLEKEEQHRGTTESVSGLFTTHGFKVKHCFTETFHMNFLDGSSFLNHHFVKLGWLGSWLELFPKEERREVFSKLEEALNTYTRTAGSLSLGVPMAYLEGVKV